MADRIPVSADAANNTAHSVVNPRAVKLIKRYIETPLADANIRSDGVLGEHAIDDGKDAPKSYVELWSDLFLNVKNMVDLARWERDLKRLSCTCDAFYLDWKSQHQFEQSVSFEWKWRLKSAVNAKLEKDNLALDEAATVYGLDVPAQKRTDIVAVTSFSVARHSIEHQRKCVDSWKRFGFDVYARNTPDEIAILKPDLPDVTFIPSTNTGTNFAYPTQKIKTLASTAIDLGTPVLLINSDIELRGSNALIQPSDRSMFCGIRWNYDTETPHALTEFRYGIDAFTFTPRQAAMLPSNFPFAIGHAMWDYAVPAVMQQNGVKLNIVHTPMLFHRNHKQNWSNDDWFFGQQWVKENLGLNIEYASPAFRDSLEDPGWKYSKTRWVRDC
jgi:hypothetical protein